MAFTALQKAQIRYYLGFPDQFRDIHTILESQLNGSISTESETIIVGLLADLAAVDAALVSARSRLKAHKVGSIELNDMELEQLRSEGRRFVARLASIFGIEPMQDIYSPGGSGGSSGGVIPLG
jgi:hypothetical protein